MVPRPMTEDIRLDVDIYPRVPRPLTVELSVDVSEGVEIYPKVPIPRIVEFSWYVMEDSIYLGPKVETFSTAMVEKRDQPGTSN